LSDYFVYQVVIPRITFKNKVPADAAVSAAAGRAPPSPFAAGNTKSLKGGVKGVTKRSLSSVLYSS
jgi:hypothetical protein